MTWATSQTADDPLADNRSPRRSALVRPVRAMRDPETGETLNPESSRLSLAHDLVRAMPERFELCDARNELARDRFAGMLERRQRRLEDGDDVAAPDPVRSPRPSGSRRSPRTSGDRWWERLPKY
jgi:hypothetical protein